MLQIGLKFFLLHSFWFIIHLSCNRSQNTTITA